VRRAPVIGTLRSSIGVIAVAFAAASVAIPQPRREELLSYAAASTAAHAADAIAGLSLSVACLFASFDPVKARLSLLVALAGAVWFAPDWEGWGRGPESVRSFAALATPLLLPLLASIALASTGRAPKRRAATAAATGVYVLAIITSVGRALFRAPYLDRHCWRDCLGNSFLVHADAHAANVFTDIWRWASIPIGVAVAAVAASRLRAVRRPLEALGLAIALAAIAEAAYAAALVNRPAEDPRASLFSGVFFARAGSWTLLALALALALLHTRHVRTRIGRLAAALDETPPPGKLRAVLAQTLRDPTLEVAYWVPSAECCVDHEGRRIEPPRAGPGRAATRIVRGGQPVAIVGHDAALLDGRELAEQLGSTARLAVDSERLQAGILYQLRDLKASRARIVAAADGERRRLERNLHDGAQQRLLAVVYELRLALSAAERDDDRALEHLLEQSIADLTTAIAELRELARGI
jgi:signal transduction histidine kinase